MDLDRARARIAELNAFANFVETFADREPLLNLCRTSQARARIAELNAFANVETFADREPLLNLCRTSHFRHELFPKTLGDLLFLRVPHDHHP